MRTKIVTWNIEEEVRVFEPGDRVIIQLGVLGSDSKIGTVTKFVMPKGPNEYGTVFIEGRETGISSWRVELVKKDS